MNWANRVPTRSPNSFMHRVGKIIDKELDRINAKQKDGGILNDSERQWCLEMFTKMMGNMKTFMAIKKVQLQIQAGKFGNKSQVDGMEAELPPDTLERLERIPGGRPGTPENGVE